MSALGDRIFNDASRLNHKRLSQGLIPIVQVRRVIVAVIVVEDLCLIISL